MGFGNFMGTRIANRSARHKVWVVVSKKARPEDKYDSLFQVALEPGTASPKGVDVDFVRGHESGAAVTFNGTSLPEESWWKLSPEFLNPYAAVDVGPGGLLLSIARGSITTVSGTLIKEWGGTRPGTWAEVGGTPERVDGGKPAPSPTPPPPSTPAPPAGPKPGTPPPSTSAPSPAPPTPGPPPQGLPPAAWLTGVQARLKYLAFYDGPIHDRFDAPTRTAVLAFQGKYGLKVDGIPGPRTQTKLAEVVGA
jgi:hypothetical protein